MTTTTFKSVGGTNKAAEPVEKPAKKAKATPAAAKPQKKAAKPGTVTIKGKGTIPVFGDGSMRRLPKGEPVTVSAAELAFLKHSKVALA